MKITHFETRPKSDFNLRRRGKVRVFVFPQGETTFEHLLNRRNRPVDTFRAAAKKALAISGYEGTKLRWSQKAGCSCGCSPGFIADVYDDKDLFVNVEA